MSRYYPFNQLRVLLFMCHDLRPYGQIPNIDGLSKFKPRRNAFIWLIQKQLSENSLDSPLVNSGTEAYGEIVDQMMVSLVASLFVSMLDCLHVRLLN